jgi:hypothetical protein
LHNAQGKNWRTATDSDRLTTIADFIAKARMSGKLIVTIQGENDLKFYATELSNCLTELLKSELTDNQPVTDSAIMCMITMKWLN